MWELQSQCLAHAKRSLNVSIFFLLPLTQNSDLLNYTANAAAIRKPVMLSFLMLFSP